MNETVAAGQDVDERTELGDVDHLAHIHATNIGLWRVDDAENPRLGFLDAEPVDGTDGHNAMDAIVVDIDIRPGFLLNGVDDLALRPDDLADLVEGNHDRNDLRCRFRHGRVRGGDTGVHVGQNLVASFLGLGQRSDQDVGRNAVDLGVQLQGRNRVGRTGNLEVHVAKGIFGTKDVGQGGVLALGVDKAHRDTGHWGLDWHTGVHQRQAAGADRGHRGGTVGSQYFGNQTQRIAELILAWQHRDQRTSSKCAVANFATLGRTDATGLTIGPGGHVVVKQEVLVGFRVQRVQQLVHPWHGQGGHVQDLGLATLEQARAVRSWQDANFAGQRAQIARTATIDTHTFIDNPLAHKLLGQATYSFLDFLLPTSELTAFATQLGNGFGAGGISGGITVSLQADRDGLTQRVFDRAFDRSRDLWGVIGSNRKGHLHDWTLGRNDAGNQLALQGNGLFDPDLAGFQTTGKHCFVNLWRTVGVVSKALFGTTGFDHHDCDIAVIELTPGNNEFEGAGGALGIGRVRNPLTILAIGDAHGTNGAIKRDATDHERG